MDDDVRALFFFLIQSWLFLILLFPQNSQGDFSDGLDEFEESADEANFKKKVSLLEFTSFFTLPAIVWLLEWNDF